MKKTAIAAAAVILSLVPLDAALAANSCVWVRNIDDFKAAQDERSIVIRDSPSHKYAVSFMGRCVGLRFTEAIAVRSVGGRFCLEPGDSISFSDNGISQRCMIDKITPLAPPAATQSGDAPSHDQDQPQGY